MQKFVTTSVPKTNMVPAVQLPTELDRSKSASPKTQPAKVQMSGYLKKKRNKVGGWRKMWFVLQDQLLLSYSSKEDYNKKLVSFKDVLNLVPGTVVRPLGGSRFTIETTTNILYTFRCDDTKACNDWMTKLVEALSIKGKNSNDMYTKKFQNVSMENIRTGPYLKSPVRFSYSCDSISRATSKNARIPIANNVTARILERNGLGSNDLDELPLDMFEKVSTLRRARKFRLHEANHPQASDQSNEVCRINQMFSRSTASAIVERDEQLSLKPFLLADRKYSTARHHQSAGAPDNCYNVNIECLLDLINVPDLNRVQRIMNCEKKDIQSNGQQHQVDFNQNKMLSGSGEESKLSQDDLLCCSQCAVPNTNVESEFQRMSLRGSSPQNGTSTPPASTSCLHSTLVVNTDVYSTHRADDAKSPAEATKKDTSPSPTSSSGKSPSSDYGSSSGCCPDGGSSCGNSTASTAEDATPLYSRLSAPTSHPPEPIYAVVDLKTKYERRARIQMELRAAKELHALDRPKSLHVVTSDYEEVLNFSSEYLDDDDTADEVDGLRVRNRDEDENENIYEPINFPERPFSHPQSIPHQRHVLWKYFPRISLEALIEMTRNKKKDLRCEQSSPFSDIRRKLGNHRKSIKIRMKKFYTRDQGVMHKERNAFSDDELDTRRSRSSPSSPTSDNCTTSSSKPTASFVMNEIDKYRRGEKHIFGSLSRLKKSRPRVSMHLEENTRKLVSSPTNPCFQAELGKELIRRTASTTALKKNGVCNSKFYD